MSTPKKGLPQPRPKGVAGSPAVSSPLRKLPATGGTAKPIPARRASMTEAGDVAESPKPASATPPVAGAAKPKGSSASRSLGAAASRKTDHLSKSKGGLHDTLSKFTGERKIARRNTASTLEGAAPAGDSAGSQDEGTGEEDSGGSATNSGDDDAEGTAEADPTAANGLGAGSSENGAELDMADVAVAPKKDKKRKHVPIAKEVPEDWMDALKRQEVEKVEAARIEQELADQAAQEVRAREAAERQAAEEAEFMLKAAEEKAESERKRQERREKREAEAAERERKRVESAAEIAHISAIVESVTDDKAAQEAEQKRALDARRARVASIMSKVRYSSTSKLEVTVAAAVADAAAQAQEQNSAAGSVGRESGDSAALDDQEDLIDDF